MSYADIKYIRLLSTSLPQFKEKSGNTFNFRCPICGDSAKSKTKARGYIYQKNNKFNFRCHNCGNGMSLGNFIKYVNPSLYQDYIAEKFTSKYKKIEEKPKPSKNPLLKNYTNPLKNAILISDIPDDHDAIQYLKDRKIPRNKWSDIYYVHEISDIANTLEKYKNVKFDDHPRLIFPFRNKDGKITHIQGRAIDSVPKSQRYVTLEVRKNATKVFGADKCNFNKDYFVLEGPIDSMFVENSIGMGGSDLDFSMLNKEHTIFVFDNEPRNKEIRKRMKHVINLGYKIVIWDKTVCCLNDVNDMVISRFTIKELNEYMKSRVFSGLKASIELHNFIKNK